MSGQNSNSPVFLITGCSTGLGRELALAALASGFRVIATARRLDTLTDLETRGAKILELDVTSSVRDLAAFAEKAIAVYGQVDYLINNAGFAQSGAIEEVSPEEALTQFNTNFFGLVNTTNAFLPHFRSRRAGTLVNFSSEITCTTLPGIGMYSATKAAVDAVSDTWARELAEYGIRSISVQPSGFRTEFFNNAGARPAGKIIEGYELVHGTINYMATEYARIVPGDPVKAARNIIKVVTRPEPLPLRFVVGDDAFASFKAFYEKRLEEMETLRGAEHWDEF
ncbi:Short-chain dehydrogenase reductase sdr [Mycena venus]|uniref:Short-chain dehydrogenase reductase sdr n=1 Tax=Mycena venus TaxID=2733690 RepID=A0A8H7CG56_9AGAR|nr:Short-chain dehydrogenase reductase sdr [Mycena venus]